MDPVRSCIVCRKRKSKKDLFRVVSNKENMALYDKNQNINSRAIYLCKTHECIDKCRSLLIKGKLNIKIPLDSNSINDVLLDLENELGE